MTLRRRRPGLVYPVNEDWHYVGEAGEPAFQNSWAWAGSGPHLAFRKRESGVIDIQGTIDSGSNYTVFTLPVGYRPTANTSTVGIGYTVADGNLAMTIGILTNGNVNISVNPGGGDSYPDIAIFGSAQFFLTPASAP